MKHFILVLLGYSFSVLVAHAQIDHRLSPEVLHNDSIVMSQVIRPFLKSAAQSTGLPDWKMLRTSIATRFDDTYADRNVTRARIYYYYNRDWSQFCKAIVQYTQAYEYRDSLSLMNMNAKMILDHSTDPDDWKAAHSWAKYASEKDPANSNYKTTCDALAARINGQ
jgi:hypothetical protein